MISTAFIISLLVLSIHYTLQDGEIFGKLGEWLYKHLPKYMHQPAFDCNVCMTAWYGSAIYLIWHGVNWQWPIVVITAMGMNIVYNKWAPKDEPDLSDRVSELESKLNDIHPNVS